MQHLLTICWQDFEDLKIGSEELLVIKCAQLYAKHNAEKFKKLMEDIEHNDI